MSVAFAVLIQFVQLSDVWRGRLSVVSAVFFCVAVAGWFIAHSRERKAPKIDRNDPHWLRKTVKFYIEEGTPIRFRLNIENSVSMVDPNYTGIRDNACIEDGKEWLRALRRRVDDDFPIDERRQFQADQFTAVHLKKSFGTELPKDVALVATANEVSFEMSKLERLLERL